MERKPRTEPPQKKMGVCRISIFGTVLFWVDTFCSALATLTVSLHILGGVPRWLPADRAQVPPNRGRKILLGGTLECGIGKPRKPYTPTYYMTIP